MPPPRRSAAAPASADAVAGADAGAKASARPGSGASDIGASTNTNVAAKAALYAGCSFISLVVLEHVARLLEIEHRPQMLLDAANDRARALFTWLGAMFAYASSFLERLKLDELIETAGDVAMSVAKFASTPLWFVYGYTHEVLVNAHPWVIWLGSAIIAGSILYAARAHLVRAAAWAREHATEIVGAAAFSAVVYWFVWDVSLLELVAPRLRATLKAL